MWLFPHFARQNAWAVRKVSVLWISVGDVHMSSFEYFGTLGVHRVRWLGPSLVRFAATNCQAGEILNETEIHNKKRTRKWVSESWGFFCLIVCAIVGIFPRFVISLLSFSTRQDTLQELHRKLQSLEERLEEELLKTGKALRKDFREDTERWGDDFRVLKRVDPNFDSGQLPNSISFETTSSPLVKERLGRLAWPPKQGFRYHFPNKNAHKNVICDVVAFHPPAFWKGIVSIQTAGASASTLVYFE